MAKHWLNVYSKTELAYYQLTTFDLMSLLPECDNEIREKILLKSAITCNLKSYQKLSKYYANDLKNPIDSDKAKQYTKELIKWSGNTDYP